MSGGCENSRSLDANRQAFADHDWVTRVFTNTAARSLATTLFGQPLCRAVRHRADGHQRAVGVSRRPGPGRGPPRPRTSPMIMSGTSLIRMEEVARPTLHAWFQAYVPGEPERILALLDRVERAGFGTLVVTVDTPVVGQPREQHPRRLLHAAAAEPAPRLGRHHAPALAVRHRRCARCVGMACRISRTRRPRAARRSCRRTCMRDFGARDHLDWEHFALMRRRWKGTLVVKGILHPRDARQARDARRRRHHRLEPRRPAARRRHCAAARAAGDRRSAGRRTTR